MTPICRTCLKVITKNALVYQLDGSEPDSVSMWIKSKLQACIPEMSTNVVKNPVICSHCLESLTAAYEFRKKCLETEKLLLAYIINAKPTIDRIEIGDVVKRLEETKNNADSNLETKVPPLGPQLKPSKEMVACVRGLKRTHRGTYIKIRNGKIPKRDVQANGGVGSDDDCFIDVGVEDNPFCDTSSADRTKRLSEMFAQNTNKCSRVRSKSTGNFLYSVPAVIGECIEILDDIWDDVEEIVPPSSNITAESTIKNAFSKTNKIRDYSRTRPRTENNTSNIVRSRRKSITILHDMSISPHDTTAVRNNLALSLSVKTNLDQSCIVSANNFVDIPKQDNSKILPVSNLCADPLAINPEDESAIKIEENDFNYDLSNIKQEEVIIDSCIKDELESIGSENEYVEDENRQSDYSNVDAFSISSYDSKQSERTQNSTSYSCAVCGYSCDSESVLVDHTEIHINEKRYKKKRSNSDYEEDFHGFSHLDLHPNCISCNYAKLWRTVAI